MSIVKNAPHGARALVVLTATLFACGACGASNESVPAEGPISTAKEALGADWGLLANPGFEQQPMKGTYFFAGDWRNGSNWYSVKDPGPAPTANNALYTVYPSDARHLGWSEPAPDGTYPNQAFAIDQMRSIGANVVVMSSWGARGTPYWRLYAPMQTSTYAQDELFTAAAAGNLLILPAIESFADPLIRSNRFALGDDLWRYQDTANIPAPAPGDNTLLGQVEDLVKRYLLCPANPSDRRCLGTATQAGWPSRWAQLSNSTNESRYAINLVFTCSNVALDDSGLARALSGLAQKVAVDLGGYKVGFTLDPQVNTSPLCDGTYMVNPSAAVALAQSPAFLGIQSYRDEISSGGDKNSDADRIREKRRSIDGWVGSGVPVILDVTAGYDARYLPNHDPSYGNDDNWRNYQSQLKGSGVRGITMNAWNGFTEGWAGMQSGAADAGSFEPRCGVGSSNVVHSWLIDTFFPGPRTCDTLQYVNGVPQNHVYGLICSKWYALAGSLGFLGDARGSEQAATCTSGGRRTSFQGGTILWAPNLDPHETHGIIGTTYANRGYDCLRVGGQRIGIPVSDEEDSPPSAYCAANGRRNRFQHGTIDWCPGATTGYVHP
jgi:hypothetical protein